MITENSKQGETSSGTNGNDSPRTNGYNGKIGQVRQRHDKIRQLVQNNGFVTIESLAQEFGVTPQTIRRDINVLSENGLINRYHGGAGIATSTENVAFSIKGLLIKRSCTKPKCCHECSVSKLNKIVQEFKELGKN